MGKAAAIIFCYSICVCGLFVTFSYLLSKINPEKITTPSEDSLDVNDNNEAGHPLSRGREDFNNKEKTRPEPHAFYSDLKNISGSDKEEWRRDASVKTNEVNDLESTADLNKSASSEHSVGFRRSVDVPNTANDTESVIMKILDEDGYPKIEIKISKKRRKKKKSKLRKSNSFSTAFQNNSNVGLDSAMNNIVTNLLHNNTLISEHKNDNWNNVSNILERNNITIEIKPEDEFVPILTTEVIATLDNNIMLSINNTTTPTVISLVRQQEKLNKTIDLSNFHW